MQNHISHTHPKKSFVLASPYPCTTVRNIQIIIICMGYYGSLGWKSSELDILQGINQHKVK